MKTIHAFYQQNKKLYYK